MSKSSREILYEQSVRAVEQQVRQLDELRTRAAVVLAASGVVTGFLGQAAVDAGLGPFGYLAIAAFVVSALACVWVLLPRWDAWEFGINSKLLKPWFLHPDRADQPDALFEYLADAIADDFAHNMVPLATLYRWFTWACIALSIEVVLWLLALALD